MLYHQNQHRIYNPKLVPITLGSYSLTVNYMEKLDQSCVEVHHVHDCYEIYFSLRGGQLMHVNEEKFRLEVGHLLLLRPGIYHHTIYEPNASKRYLVLTFTTPVASTGKSKVLKSEDIFFTETFAKISSEPYILCADKFGCKEVVSRIKYEFKHSFGAQFQMMVALYQEFLISTFRNINTNTPTGKISDHSNLCIEITKYMHANYHKNISVQDIADTFYVSPRHVNRVFEQFFGISFKNLLNMYRLNYAKNYLIDTDLSIERISDLVGFSSTKVMYQLFHREEGLTIAEWRATHQKPSEELVPMEDIYNSFF